MNLKRIVTVAGSATALGAALLVGTPASAEPTGAMSSECGSHTTWLASGTQYVVYSNCGTASIDKRAIIHAEPDDVGPCVTVPAGEFKTLHSAPARTPFLVWPDSVEDC